MTTNEPNGTPTPIEDTEKTVAALAEYRNRLDAAVYSVLQTTPIPAIEICRMLGLRWPEDAGNLRSSFLRLEEQGKAQLTYGRGWGRTPGDG